MKTLNQAAIEDLQDQIDDLMHPDLVSSKEQKRVLKTLADNPLLFIKQDFI
jgi:hypothetical protein